MGATAAVFLLTYLASFHTSPMKGKLFRFWTWVPLVRTLLPCVLDLYLNEGEVGGPGAGPRQLARPPCPRCVKSAYPGVAVIYSKVTTVRRVTTPSGLYFLVRRDCCLGHEICNSGRRLPETRQV